MIRKDACNHQWTTYKTEVNKDKKIRIRKQKCKHCEARRKFPVPLEYAPSRISPNAGYSSIPPVVESSQQAPTLE